MHEEWILEIGTPEGAIWHAGFRQAGVQIQHADETGPLTAPVRNSEDWTLVADEAVQDVVAVLPRRLDDYERGLARDQSEDFHSVLLAVYKAVAPLAIAVVAAADFVSLAADRAHHGLFHL